MSRSLLWINNLKNEDTEIQVFDTAETGAEDVYNITWNFKADYRDVMNATGTLFAVSEWAFSYMTAGGGGGTSIVIAEVATPATPEQMQVILNTDAESSAMGEWTVVQLTKWTGESSDDVDTIEEDVKFEFNITCDLDPTWLEANVDIFYPSDKDPFPSNGAIALRIDTGSGFGSATVQASSNKENFFRPQVKNPTTKAFENLVEVQSYDLFDYQALKISASTDSYMVREFVVYSNNPNQLLQPFLFERVTATGKHFQKVITPTISPYQQQRYVKSPYLEGYKMDGFTTIKYKILANTETRILMHKQSSTNIIEQGLVSSPNFKQHHSYFNQGGPTPAPPPNNPQPTPPPQPTTPPTPMATPPPAQTPSAPYVLQQVFKDNMENGYVKFGCKFLKNRLQIQKDKLATLQAKPPGQRNPRWQDLLKLKIDYIEDLQVSKNCVLDITQEYSTDEFGDPGDLGSSWLGKKLWMPTEAFMKESRETENRQDSFLTKIDQISFPFEKT